jgi:hypothetical protein
MDRAPTLSASALSVSACTIMRGPRMIVHLMHSVRFVLGARDLGAITRKPILGLLPQNDCVVESRHILAPYVVSTN